MTRTERTVAVVDRDLPKGLAANAAAVLALTLGANHPELPGEELIDATGARSPGLIPTGVAVLGAPRDQLAAVRSEGLERGLDVVCFPAAGQTTNDYDEFRRVVARDHAPEYLGLILSGDASAVRSTTGSLPLLR